MLHAKHLCKACKQGATASKGGLSTEKLKEIAGDKLLKTREEVINFLKQSGDCKQACDEAKKPSTKKKSAKKPSTKKSSVKKTSVKKNVKKPKKRAAKKNQQK